MQLTNDDFDDAESSWMPNSSSLIFSSDRPNEYYPLDKQDPHLYLSVDADSTLYGFAYGFYSLFKLDVDSRQVTPLDVGPGRIGPRRYLPTARSWRSFQTGTVLIIFTLRISIRPSITPLRIF